jgi:multiple sugar transport system permease protein
VARALDIKKVKAAAPWLLIYRRKSEHLFFRILIYLMLLNMSFVFLLPVMHMGATGLMTVQDYIDPAIKWIPLTLNWANYNYAAQAMHYWEALKNSAIIAVLAAIGQALSCSMAGYGFGRLKFPGREILFALALFTFIVPPQTIIISLFIMFRRLRWTDTGLPFIVPAFFGQGLRGALIILIFRQFFRRLPFELEEAALIDGCGPIRTYWTIMMPLAKPAIVVSILFSLVWHWNDFYLPNILIQKATQNFTVALRLKYFGNYLTDIVAEEIPVWNEPLIMAACMLSVLPPFIMYLFTQRQFVESVERTGLVD